MTPERTPELDRPALTYTHGDKEYELGQNVGFDDAVYDLDYALEKGWLKHGEVPRVKIPLSEYWKTLWKKKGYL